MRAADRERKSRRLFFCLILGLLIGYAAMKTWHIQLALQAYEGQVLSEDTSLAAK